VLGLVKGILLSKWILLGGLAVAAWQGWTVLRPRRWEPSDLQKAVVENVCWDAAEALPPDLPGIQKIAVLRLAGRDSEGYVSRTLAECVGRSGRYDVLHEGFVAKLMRELGLDDAPVEALADATKAGRKMGVDGVLFGEVAEFTSDRTSASIRLNLRLASVESGEAVFAESFARREPPDPASVAGVRQAILGSHVVKRILIWLAVAALLPLLLFPLVKRLLEEESNAVNFGLLAGLTLVDLALAFVLCGLTVSAWLPGVLLIAAGVAGAAYNYWLCSNIEKLRK
jgi:hypothetical protein